jgi:hypothetical protein
MRTKVITQRTVRYDPVVTIGRHPGGSHTHILVSYLPNAVLN